ncbi:DUF4333 domain-containing protein [Mycobacterium sp. SM1]|uniref:DUF4333 domain-containing protein n=1 Tax=Mycobacterium sp. SM1 TaxID=2816243 RepID=UPI001BD03F07|nr:DUF4333 domain-containing protein [Mycobacterium sp. SM1]MBS4730456.1 DUF4333 domain-containing protein [Mycobacterium sp. SM1]
MSGPQEPDPTQWQPPGQGEGQQAQQPPVQASPWQPGSDQQAWQAPAYTPPEYQPYQQPSAPFYPPPPYQQQYPQPTPGYPRQEPYAAPPGQYPPQPGPYTAAPGQYPPQPGQYGQTGQYPPQPGQYGQPPAPSRRSVVVIGTVVGVFAAVVLAVVLVLGFWAPGFFVTTKLDISKAQAGVQQILSDETNGYGAKNVKDVKCNNGQDPIVKKGATFDCEVSIDGTIRHVTVTFQDNKGTYEVGRPK